MGIFEIISAIVLIIACVFIVIVVLMQDTKTQMSQTISGNTGDNYFGKNSGTNQGSAAQQGYDRRCDNLLRSCYGGKRCECLLRRFEV